MFVIGIRYLCGWAMATHTSDRQQAEWPPHPDRVFMALAAAHFETDGGPEEYEALRRAPGGIGVARLVGSTCSGCNLTLSNVEVNRIRKAPPEQVDYCEECGRLLVP
jgi:hypothetical protein